VLPDATGGEGQQAEQRRQAASEAQDRPEHDRRAHELQAHGAHQQRRHRHVDRAAGRPPGADAEEERFRRRFRRQGAFDLHLPLSVTSDPKLCFLFSFSFQTMSSQQTKTD